MFKKISKNLGFIFLVATFATACKSPSVPEEPIYTVSTNSEWYELHNRLTADGIYGNNINYYFNQIEGEFTQLPMGAKVTELYNIVNKPKPVKKASAPKSQPKPTPNPTGIPRPWYNGVVTEANAIKCRDFINTYATTFEKMEREYKIPAEIVSALIYVETRHGNYLGKHNAFVILASMANSTKTTQIPDYIKKLPKAKEQNEWILTKMKEKSDWAYGELKALLVYVQENNINPMELPSSIYGAVGYGQFMPSNISKYAVDGDFDDKIDLFHAPDGIMSVANYLSKHGWNKNPRTLNEKIKVLLRYNYSSTYARTILALSVLTKKAMNT